MNRTIEQAKKYASIQAPNGYKFHINRFLYGCARGDEYPAFIKEIKQDDNFTYYRLVYFFKYYNGSSAVYVETFSRKKGGGEWQVINHNPGYSDNAVEVFPVGTRYSTKLLFKYCIDETCESGNESATEHEKI